MTLPVYPAAKAALPMLTVQYARALDSNLANAATRVLPEPVSTTAATPQDLRCPGCQALHPAAG